MDFNRKRKILKYTFISVIIIILIIIFKNINLIFNILSPFIVSLVLAYLLNPVICYMETKGIKRWIGVLITYGVLILFVLSICFYIIPQIMRDMTKLLDVLPKINEEFMAFITNIQDRYTKAGFNLPGSIKNALYVNSNRLEVTMASYISYLTDGIISLFDGIINYILIPFILYYFLRDYNKIIDNSRKLIPRKFRSRIDRICSNIDEVFGNYVRSQIILSFIIAVFTTLALLILKVNFALFLGIINGITNIIPYFGPVIGTIPAVLIALLQSPSKAIWTLVLLFIIQQVESGIICPIITGDSVDLHPVTVILALIIGGELYGVIGMIFGIPIIAALKIIYTDVVKSLF
jgi:predicted PurR-regulated permease PerM